MLLNGAHNDMVQRVAGVKDSLKVFASRWAECHFNQTMDPMDIHSVSSVPNYLQDVQIEIQFVTFVLTSTSTRAATSTYYL